MNTWPAEFDEILRPFCRFAQADAPIDPELPLALLGIDSMGTISLLALVEATFDVPVPDLVQTGAELATAGSLWQAVADRRAERSGPDTDSGLADRVRRGLALAPDRIAVSAGGGALTYTELHEAALSLAGALTALPGGPPRRVGVLAGAGLTPYVGILAAVYAGAAVVPLNPNFPAQRTLRTIEAAGLTTVVTDESGRATLGRLEPATSGLHVLGLDAPGGPLDAPLPVKPDDLAYIMFTSGSTGRPKGVPVSHANVLHFLDVVGPRYALSPADVVTQNFEPTFDLFMFGLFVTWSAGARLIAVPGAMLARLPQFLAEHEVTMWFSVPSAIRRVHRLGGLDPGALPSLTRSLFCGEALSADDAAMWQAAAPNSTVENLYGPTELTIACTVHRVEPGGGAPAPNGLVPIGRLHEGLSYLLLDEHGAPGADEGELCVTGPQMFGGYLDERDDEGRFVTVGDQRWYRTGDRARLLPDGVLAYLGRLDHQVKVRGYRVELPEIEYVLARQPGVDGCAVVAFDDGDGTTLGAFCLGAPADAATLLREASRQLPEYMVPRHVWAVAELPLNANGKVDRTALAARAQELTGCR
jgi:amino acid adenylation domain-containing protein